MHNDLFKKIGWMQHVVNQTIDWKYEKNLDVRDFVQEMSYFISYCRATRSDATDEINFIYDKCIG